MSKVKEPTQFEKAVEAVKAGTLQTPYVNFEGKQVPYFLYQLAVHHFNLKIMAAGMKCRGIKFTDIKKYYGFKGNVQSCVDQMATLLENFKKEYLVN